MKIFVLGMWIAFVISFLVYRRKKSGLFLEIEDIYNNDLDAIGKVILMKQVIETYSYQEKLSALEQEVYEVDISECFKKDRVAALKAEIESENISETIFSIINTVLPVIWEKRIGSSDLDELIWVKYFFLLIVGLWIVVYIEDMKRNKFIMSVLEAIEVTTK